MTAPPPAATPPPEPARPAWCTRTSHGPEGLACDCSEPTPAPGVSGETRETSVARFVEAVRDAEREVDALGAPGPWDYSGLLERHLGRAPDAVLAALAPGPDTARDGEAFWQARAAQLEEAREEMDDERLTAVLARDAARRERDDLKAAVERLCDEAEKDQAGRSFAVTVKAADLRALLTPPDAGRDVGEEG